MPKVQPTVEYMLLERLFLLQRLGRVGAGGAEGLPEDSQKRDAEGEGSGESHVPAPARDGSKVEPGLFHNKPYCHRHCYCIGDQGNLEE